MMFCLMHSLGILLSGRGSNFVAIADSIDAGRIPDARIGVVISNKPGAPGITIARERGLTALVIPSKGRTREEHDREVVAALQGGMACNWSVWRGICDCCRHGSCDSFRNRF